MNDIATGAVEISRTRRAHGSLWALLFVIGVLSIVSLGVGPATVGYDRLFDTVFGAGAEDRALRIILLEIRLPRTILAILIGAGLGMSGAALQALVQNPIAEPGIVGVSSMSALGAVAVFYTGLTAAHPLGLPLAGVAGALACVAVLFVLAGRGVSTLTLVLAGVAINSFAGAITALALNLAPSPFAAYEIFFWLLGSLANRSFDHVTLLLPLSVTGFVLLLVSARRLDTFALGDDVAHSLGVDVKTTQRLVIGGCACAVGSGVAVAGIVGFVGLVVPHLLRPVVGHRPRWLIPASGLGGSALTLGADIVCRTLRGSGELHLGVVTALIGAPFFFYLLLKQRHLQ